MSPYGGGFGGIGSGPVDPMRAMTDPTYRFSGGPQAGMGIAGLGMRNTLRGMLPTGGIEGGFTPQAAILQQAPEATQTQGPPALGSYASRLLNATRNFTQQNPNFIPSPNPPAGLPPGFSMMQGPGANFGGMSGQMTTQGTQAQAGPQLSSTGIAGGLNMSQPVLSQPVNQMQNPQQNQGQQQNQGGGGGGGLF